MKTIKLNKNISLDLPTLLDTRLLVQANSGGGKSWLLRRLLEQSHGKVQQIIIDLEGEFSTLREKYDYVLAGKGGDTPAEPRHAALLARKLLEHNVSAIIDLYELNHIERKHFVKLFLDAMVNAPKELWHPCLVVIDEAHQFCPEKGQAESMDAVIDLATRGRKRGYCVVLATQRLSKLHKDAAAECNNKLIGRTGLDIDMKRAAEELGFTSKEQYLSLRSLEAGEFFMFGPAISTQVIKERVGDIQTTHPKAGSRFEVNVVPPTDKIKSILKKLGDLPAEAKKEAQTVDELKAEIRTLRAHKCPVVQTNPVRIEKIEVPMVGKRTLEGLKKSESNIRRMVKSVKEASASFDVGLAQLGKVLMKFEQKNASVVSPARSVARPVVQEIKRQHVPLPVERTRFDSEPALNELTNPEKKILNALAWLESIGVNEPEQTAVAFLAGYTAGGGAFNNPKGSLRSRGYIEYRGRNLALTESGRSEAKIPDQPLTTEELHKKVLDVLPGPEKKLLEVILRTYPDDISNEDLAFQAGYQVNGGAFNNPRGRLRSLGLIEYRQGRVKARDILFL